MTDEQPRSGAGVQAGDGERATVKLELDWEGLAVAFENQLPHSHSFLDLETGKVLTINNSDAVPDPPDPAEKYLYIQPRPSREGYRTMQNFIQTLDDALLIERLTNALVGKGAFRRFKDQLLNYPEVRQQWFAYKDAEVYNYIRDWLESRGIEPSNEPPPANSRPKTALPAASIDNARRDIHPIGKPAEGSEDFRQAIAPFDRPGLVFRPCCSALLVVDMQRVFADPQGRSFLPDSEEATRRLVQVIEAARRTSVPVFFTRHVHRFPDKDGGAMSRWWRSLIRDGSEDAELIDALQVQDGEPVIEKCRYSAFAGTNLEMLLRSGGVEDLIIGGVMTNLCCETTAREAFVRDFNVFFLGDGTATAEHDLHIGSLRNIAFGFGRVLGCDEAIGILDPASGAGTVDSQGTGE